MRVSLSMLPYQLCIADLRKERLKEAAWAILTIVLLSKKTRFFSFIETHDEISLVLEEESINLFPMDLLSTSPKKFRAFEATLIGGSGQQSIVSTLSQPLGCSGISIMYLSTFKTDFVLIAEPDIPNALAILNDDFLISASPSIVDELEQSSKGSPGGIPIQKHKTQQEPLLFEVSCSTDGPVSNSYSDRASNTFNLAVSRQPLHLVSMLRDLVGTQALRFIFDDERSTKDFFSYHQMEDEISMIVSQEEKEILETENVDFSSYNETFARITIDEGPLGFDQAGIVSSMATPLKEAEINLFYISTFTTDHILVKTDEIERAKAVLDHSKK